VFSPECILVNKISKLLRHLLVHEIPENNYRFKERFRILGIRFKTSLETLDLALLNKTKANGSIDVESHSSLNKSNDNQIHNHSDFGNTDTSEVSHNHLSKSNLGDSAHFSSNETEDMDKSSLSLNNAETLIDTLQRAEGSPVPKIEAFNSSKSTNGSDQMKESQSTEVDQNFSRQLSSSPLDNFPKPNTRNGEISSNSVSNPEFTNNQEKTYDDSLTKVNFNPEQKYMTKGESLVEQSDQNKQVDEATNLDSDGKYHCANY